MIVFGFSLESVQLFSGDFVGAEEVFVLFFLDDMTVVFIVRLEVMFD